MDGKKGFLRLLNMAYRYLSYRMRTKKEIQIYLEKKAEKRNLPSIIIPDVLRQLQEEHLLNDALFIEEFILSRSKYKPKGIFALTMELKQKGIPQNLIDIYFDQHNVNEYEFATKALSKKWSQIKSFQKEVRYKKGTNFLQRRGFSFETIKKTIEEFEGRE